MESLTPSEDCLLSDPYALCTEFSYNILPPKKPKKSEKAKIYKQFEQLKNSYLQNIRRLKDKIADLLTKAEEQKANGIQHRLKEFGEKLKEDLDSQLDTLSKSSLEKALAAWNPEKENNYLSCSVC